MDDHELARRYPDAWESVTTRAEVGWRFRDKLASASDPAELKVLIATYSDLLTVAERGEVRGPNEPIKLKKP